MSEPIEILVKRLTAIERGRETARGFHFFCQVGSESWKGGLTTLQISGTGWVLLSHRGEGVAPEESELYSCYISTRDLRSLIRIIQRHPFWNLDSSRWDCGDDETNVHFRLMDTSQGFAWDTQLWSGEHKAQEDLAELLQTVGLVIATVSDRKVRLTF